jgi:hypothetical protein
MKLDRREEGTNPLTYLLLPIAYNEKAMHTRPHVGVYHDDTEYAC